MSTDLAPGRVAVITGASSGIGAATARALAAAGYRVALLARRADRIQALADELGDRAVAIEADVTECDSLVAAARRVQDERGGADLLVNNAGVMLLVSRRLIASAGARSGRAAVELPPGRRLPMTTVAEPSLVAPSRSPGMP